MASRIMAVVPGRAVMQRHTRLLLPKFPVNVERCHPDAPRLETLIPAPFRHWLPMRHGLCTNLLSQSLPVRSPLSIEHKHYRMYCLEQSL